MELNLQNTPLMRNDRIPHVSLYGLSAEIHINLVIGAAFKPFDLNKIIKSIISITRIFVAHERTLYRYHKIRDLSQ